MDPVFFGWERVNPIWYGREKIKTVYIVPVGICLFVVVKKNKPLLLARHSYTTHPTSSTPT